MTECAIFNCLQGDEQKFLDEISDFINSEPKKIIHSINPWTVGIQTYFLLIYENVDVAVIDGGS